MDYYGSGSKYGNSTTKSVHEKKQNLSISKVNEGKSVYLQIKFIEIWHQNWKSMSYKLNLSIQKRSLYSKKRTWAYWKGKLEER